MEKGQRASEWLRCSEGFSDLKNLREPVESKSLRNENRSGHHRFPTNSGDNIASDIITWSSSDSEDERFIEMHLGKRKKVTKSSSNKRNSLQVSQPRSSSDTVKIETASDSDSDDSAMKGHLDQFIEDQLRLQKGTASKASMTLNKNRWNDGDIDDVTSSNDTMKQFSEARRIHGDGPERRKNFNDDFDTTEDDDSMALLSSPEKNKSNFDNNTDILCSCNKQNCIGQFSYDVILNHILKVKRMGKAEKELYLMGEIDSVGGDYTLEGAQRQRCKFIYNFEGRTICHRAFEYLYDIGDKALKSLTKHMSMNGKVPRVHGNIGRTPRHALESDDVKYCIEFLEELADREGSPGPSPSKAIYGKQDIYLPQGMRKVGVHQKYKDACADAGRRSMKLTSFWRTWEVHCPHIKTLFTKGDKYQERKRKYKTPGNTASKQEKWMEILSRNIQLQKQVKEETIQGYESNSDIDDVTSADGPSQRAMGPGSTESPSISGSTQSISPPTTSTRSGVRASEWVKSLQLKTPSKTEYQGETTTAEDSAKKKKKHSRGGLAEQMSRLQAREKSSVRMWSHQQNKSLLDSQDSSKSISLRVLGFEVLYSMKIVKCAVLLNGEETEEKLVMFPVSQTEQMNLQVGTEVIVYPPWQQLEMNDGQSVLLCARYCQVTFQPGEDTLREGSSLSKGTKETVTAEWNCPCFQGLCKYSTQCPASKFPCVPGLLSSKKTEVPDDKDTGSENKSRVASPEKHLHTVAKKSKEGTCVSDSLLKSIESSFGYTDKLDIESSSISFRGTVHRVNSSTCKTENRSLLLVEDSHGTFCEIQLASSILQEAGIREDSMEGQSYQFSGLHVQCRTTRDKDIPLFSLIDSVWSRTRAMLDSQGSECDTSKQQSTSVEPPSYCYILTASETDQVMIKPNPDVIETKPAVFSELASWVREDGQARRLSCLARLVYVHQPLDSDVSSTETILFITDKSLINKSQPYLRCHCSRDCFNQQKLIQHRTATVKVVELKDLYVEQGKLLIDVYTKVKFHEEANSEMSSTNFQLPIISSTVMIHDLCSISGNIAVVDEDSAYSWEVCNFCGSDNLYSQMLFVKCKSCDKIVTDTETKIKMEIIILCDNNPQNAVRIDLLQTTIEKLLPSTEEHDDGYELSSVLNKHVGPINCIVTNRQKTVTLKEIKLLV